MVIIRIVGSADGSRSNMDGLYLKSFDPEAMSGLGHAVGTPHRDEARQFNNPAEAWTFWKTVPKCRPRRYDGKPNRPLTSFNIELLTGNTPSLFE